MAAARRLLVQGRVLSCSSLVGSTQESSCCTNSLALKHLRGVESARQVSTSVRYMSGLSARPLLQAGDCVGNQGRKEKCFIRRMSAATEPTTDSDIIERVKHDHEELEEHYSNYKKAHQRGDEDEARKWFNQFVWEISRHAVSEELVLYPLLSAQDDHGKDLVEQSLAEHQKTKSMLEDLQNTTDPDIFEQKMSKMMSELREHIKKEETEDLVYLQEKVSRNGREAAGATFSLGKNLAPTRPHVGVPNKPAALEAALGLLITPVDKLRDVFTPFPSKN